LAEIQNVEGTLTVSLSFKYLKYYSPPHFVLVICHQIGFSSCLFSHFGSSTQTDMIS
jgi:hypothetical protein